MLPYWVTTFCNLLAACMVRSRKSFSDPSRVRKGEDHVLASMYVCILILLARTLARLRKKAKIHKIFFLGIHTVAVTKFPICILLTTVLANSSRSYKLCIL